MRARPPPSAGVGVLEPAVAPVDGTAVRPPVARGSAEKRDPVPTLVATDGAPLVATLTEKSAAAEPALVVVVTPHAPAAGAVIPPTMPTALPAVVPATVVFVFAGTPLRQRRGECAQQHQGGDDECAYRPRECTNIESHLLPPKPLSLLRGESCLNFRVQTMTTPDSLANIVPKSGRQKAKGKS